MTKLTGRIVNLGMLCLVLAASACGDDDDPTVAIISPATDSTLTIADDVDPVLDGIQVSVEVQVENESDGEDVWLYTDASVLSDMPDAEPTTIESLLDGAATFTVTLAPGVHDLLACVGDCRFRSRQVRVTVVAGCGGITFIDPAPSAGDITELGPTDDIDGEACGDQFTTNVRVTTTVEDGTSLQLFVNGSPGPSTTASSGQGTFENVILSPAANTLAVQVTDGAATCQQPYPNSLQVDCDGVSCAITLPSGGTSFLNASDDVSAADGFQADFEITGGVEAAGESFNLIVDGTILTEASSMIGGSAVAQFAAIDLSEGAHNVVAECFDAAGNRTRTEPAQWIVDTIPCDVTIAEPVADTLFVDADDVDAGTDGIQVNVNGTVSGAACTGVTAGPCGGAGSALALTAPNYGGNATLASTPMQEMCVIVTDEAGNTGEARVSLRVRTDAPQLQISTPTSGAAFNELGTMGATADLMPSTDACDLAATVSCTEVGSPVELLVGASVLGTADCVAMAGLPAPFTGQADFPSIPVPSRNDGSSVSIVARQTVDRLVGMSAPIDLAADCDEPTLSFFSPSCGSVLSPTDDDEDPGTPGFQYSVTVLNPSINEVDLTTLTAVDSGGGSVLSQMSSTRSGQSILFDADFGAGGVLTMRACATDAAGNIGCSPDCAITILDLPAVAITSPVDGSRLNASDDCDLGTPGMQVRVTGTTDASDATPASITFGSLAPQTVSISGGTIDACVDAEEGSGVSIVLSVDGMAGTASASVTINVDSAPPTTAISDLTLASTVDRRGGIARLQYTSVADEDGSTLVQTEVRCSTETIDDEADWAAAAVFASRAAASPSSVVAEDVSGFLVGVPYFCVARSTDGGDNITPLPGDGGTSVLLQFLEQSIELGTATTMGDDVVSVGDIDGDLVNDFIIAGSNEVHIFFGRTTFAAGAEAPDLTIVGDGNFAGPTGGSIAALGDFNGDTRPDFAVGAGFGDSAYVFLGKATRAEWGTGPIVVGSGLCVSGAICLRGPAGEFFGWHVATAGDFNGDGVSDLSVGSPGADAIVGAQYVVLGSSSIGTGVGVDVTTVDGFEIRSGGMAPDQQFIGASTAALGDVTSDGRTDLVFGASGSAAPMPATPGRVRRLNGRMHSGTSGLDLIDWDTLTEIGSGQAGRYAETLYVLGDVTGGGSVDIGVQVNSSVGSVQVFTGESGFMTGFSMTNDLPNATNDRYGQRSANGMHPALGGLGQIDDSPAMELFIASIQAGTGPGDARLWYGPTTGATARSTATVVFRPALTGGEMSGEVSAGFVGDLNGDGYLDLAVGEPKWPTGDATASGRVTLYY